MKVQLKVNGEQRQVDVEPDTPLLWVLRDELQLLGTKYGCGIAQCGACTVHLDGRPARSCMVAARNVGDREVTTIEGVSGPVAAAVQAAWEKLQVPQCGYCQSGQVMAAIALVRDTPRPGDEDVDRAMAGNVCRCATYARIRRAVHEAAATVRR
jgi:isoquinoline 1-oxidoreductase subunit alpha